jgi:hypothetical protein
MVRVICITTAFIFDESKSALSVNDIRVDTNIYRKVLTGDSQQFEELEYRTGRDDHIYERLSDSIYF